MDAKQPAKIVPEMTPLEAAQRIEEHNLIHSRKEPHAFFITQSLNLAASLLRKIASGEYAPVVHGRWVYSRTESEFSVSKCSVCRKERFAISEVVTKGKFCPSCGALMDGKDD